MSGDTDFGEFIVADDNNQQDKQPSEFSAFSSSEMSNTLSHTIVTDIDSPTSVIPLSLSSQLCRDAYSETVVRNTTYRLIANAIKNYVPAKCTAQTTTLDYLAKNVLVVERTTTSCCSGVGSIQSRMQTSLHLYTVKHSAGYSVDISLLVAHAAYTSAVGSLWDCVARPFLISYQSLLAGHSTETVDEEAWEPAVELMEVTEGLWNSASSWLSKNTTYCTTPAEPTDEASCSSELP